MEILDEIEAKKYVDQNALNEQNSHFNDQLEMLQNIIEKKLPDVELQDKRD